MPTSKRTKQTTKGKATKASASNGKGDSEKKKSRGYSSVRGSNHMYATARLYGHDAADIDSTIDVGEEISAAVARLKSGDTSDLTRILTEQLHLAHAATFRFSQLMYTSGRRPSIELGLNGWVHATRATRQLAVALADLHNPKRTVFIKNQQNNLIQGEGTNAKMDNRSQRKTAAIDATAQAVVEIDRPTDGSGQEDQLYECIQNR